MCPDFQNGRTGASVVRKPVFSAAKCHSGTAQFFSSFHLHYVNAGKPVTQKYKYDPIGTTHTHTHTVSPTPDTDRGKCFGKVHEFRNDKTAV